jgi:hypothetical protein
LAAASDHWTEAAIAGTTAASRVVLSRDGWGAVLGDDVVHVEAGELGFKPRDPWHTFWNAGDGPCRILEGIADLERRYNVEHDFESVPRLCAEHGLVHPLLAAGAVSGG